MFFSFSQRNCFGAISVKELLQLAEWARDIHPFMLVSSDNGN